MIYFKATVEFDRANVFLSFKKTSISTFFRLNDENHKKHKKMVFWPKNRFFQVKFMQKVDENRHLKNQILAILDKKF